MKSKLLRPAILGLVSSILFGACKKDDVVKPAPQPVGFYNIKLRASITVGNLVYDSIPATVKITTWDQQGAKTEIDVQLEPGANIITLPKSKASYQFKMSKWGVSDEITLQNKDVVEGKLYTLGGTRAAKRISSEFIYSMQNGAFRLYKKQEYFYDGQGKLDKIANYFTDPNDPGSLPVLHTVDTFVYAGTRPERILVLDKQNPGDEIIGFSNYQYDPAGRIIAIHNRSQQTQQLYRNSFETIGDDLNIQMNLLDDFNQFSGSRTDLLFSKGNRVRETNMLPSLLESVKTYEFDLNINPYAQMNWPRSFFRLMSKNNEVVEKFNGVVSLKSDYQYDADGYVREVVKNEWNQANGEFRPVLKTVYSYQ